MKLFLKLTACILISIQSVSVKAQDADKYPDYVIIKKGDTIVCSIKTPFLSMESVYKTEASKKTIRILPWQVKEYYINRDSITYLSVRKNGVKVPDFMKAIEKGAINLLEERYIKMGGTPGVSGYMSSTTNWYISKGSDTARSLKTSELFFNKSKKSRKNIFIDMIKDKQEIYDKYLADDSFTFEELRTIVHLYNTGKWVTEFKR
ncbi:MAG: hypothetical protein V4553_15325 [Bacteroidota bacterium]